MGKRQQEFPGYEWFIDMYSDETLKMTEDFIEFARTDGVVHDSYTGAYTYSLMIINHKDYEDG